MSDAPRWSLVVFIIAALPIIWRAWPRRKDPPPRYTYRHRGKEVRGKR